MKYNHKYFISSSTLVFISSHNITQCHVVSYDLERDLIPVILANCNYTLTPGHGLSVGYDFKGLSKQIEERFIRGRPQILPQVSVTFSFLIVIGYKIYFFVNVASRTHFCGNPRIF